ncbi:YciI family protein [Amycolatopsis thailandensis]|uniref:Transcription initiation protein n=1 Tax=Amycolatopsis thailandensis TaxID=589330 RepID=A0A229S022_9PSEU|nr:YciI family protein [Amycolatopsis thailandensis]OXM52277.1 transcription initiation protein [Amycolatopsis thailandensis]
MRYLLLICGTPYPGADDSDVPLDEKTQAWVDEMTARGVRLSGSRLRSAATATTVRHRDGDLLVSDGPFAETKEQILGYDLIDCADLDEAIEVAAKHPVTKFATIEIRPIWPTP